MLRTRRAPTTGPGPTVLRAARIASIGFALAATASSTASAALSDHPDVLPGVNGAVKVVLRTDDTIFVGGSFTSVTPRRGPFSQVSPTTGAAIATPEVAGHATAGAPPLVRVTIDDGAGGLYIGGSFTHVGGLARNNAAHILADGTVDPRWNPDVGAGVWAMTKLGATVFLGGSFGGAHAINGSVDREALAAVDATTGKVTAWDSHGSTMSDLPIAMTSYGNSLYVSFNTAQGTVGYDATTGHTIGWNPEQDGIVRAMATDGTSVFLGGSFKHGNVGVARSGLAAVDMTTGTATAWTSDVTGGSFGGQVNALAIVGTTLYAVGDFTASNASTRNGATAVSTVTGATLPWDPHVKAGSALTGLAVTGSTAYLAGSFSGPGAIGGASRSGYAAVDATSGALRRWDPQAQGGGLVGVTGDKVFVTGALSQDAVARKGLAAFDAGDGHLLPWDPSTDGEVAALVASGSHLYVGGYFSHIAGAQRIGLADLDRTTGAVSLWNPAINGVRALAISGTTLYVGGQFTQAGGLSRLDAAAVDLASGSVLPFDPSPDQPVQAIAATGHAVYLGGAFTHVRSMVPNATPQSAAYAVAVDPGTGEPLPWTPPTFDDAVSELAPDGPNVLAVAGAPRVLSRLDGTTGAAVPSPPGLAATTAAFAGDPTTWFAVDGATGAIGSFDRVTGAATDWHPAATGGSSVATDGHGGVLVAGAALQDTADGGFASFSALPVATATPAIGGTASVGQTLTCGEGTWDGSIPQSRAYTWLRGGAPIDGATAASYAPGDADAGQPVACRVTSRNLGGAASVDSAPVTVAPRGAAPGGPGPGPGQSAPPTRDTTRPLVSALGLRPTSFRAARSGEPVAATAKPTTKRKGVTAKSGTTLSYRLSEPATVVFTIQRAGHGSASGKRCVETTTKLRKARAKACTLYTAVRGSFKRAIASPGTDTFTFTGRLAGHTLAKASYRLTLTATDPTGNVSVPVAATFKVTGTA